MRVSSTMMTGNYLKQLNRSYEKQAKLMEQSDGNSIHRPSDDPVAYVRTMTYKNSLTQNSQYTQNLGDAVSWMKSSDGAMSEMADILKTIKEKTIAAADSGKTETDKKTIASEIDTLIEQMVTLGNSQLGDQYLFSGQMDKTKPFVVSEVKDKADVKTLDETQEKLFVTGREPGQMIMMKNGADTYYMNPADGNVYTKDYVETGYKKDAANGTLAEQQAIIESKAVGKLAAPLTATGAVDMKAMFNTDGTVKTPGGFNMTPTGGGGATVNLAVSVSDKKVVKYMGDNVKMSMPIQNGGATPSRDSVNTTGADVFGTDIFGGSGASILNDAYEITRHMKSNDTAWLSADGVRLADNGNDQVSSGSTQLAARAEGYDNTLKMLDKQNALIVGDITKESGTNVAALSVELMTAQMLYNMSLSVGSKILPQSLSDYL